MSFGWMVVDGSHGVANWWDRNEARRTKMAWEWGNRHGWTIAWTATLCVGGTVLGWKIARLHHHHQMEETGERKDETPPTDTYETSVEDTEPTKEWNSGWDASSTSKPFRGVNLSDLEDETEEKGTEHEVEDVCTGSNYTSGQGHETRRIEYERMQKETLQAGLAMETVATTRGRFDVREGWISAWPKKYALPEHAVRILMAPVGGEPNLTTQATCAVRKIMKILPLGMQVFINPAKSYHCTIFHLSRPEEVRTNPFLEYKQVPPDGTPRRATDQVLQEEIQALQQLGKYVPTLVLEVERVILAPSGVLLMLFQDVTEASGDVVDRLRSTLRKAFPGAPIRQTKTVIHCTLMRLLTPVQLPLATREQIDAVCQSITQEVRGLRVRLPQLEFVYEEEFSTVNGPRFGISLCP